MKFQKLLKKLTSNSNHHSHQMSCVIARKNKVISVGFNLLKTHPRSNTPFRMLHAEIYSLIGLDHNITKGCTAYIYREHKNGNMAEAAPCEACELALRLAGIKKLCYSTSKGFVEKRLA